MSLVYQTLINIVKLFVIFAAPLMLARQYPTVLGISLGVLFVVVNIKLIYFYADPWNVVLADVISHLISHGDNYFYPDKKLELLKQQDTKLLDFSKKGLVWVFVSGLACVGLLNIFTLSAGLNKLLLMAIIPFVSMPESKLISKVLFESLYF